MSSPGEFTIGRISQLEGSVPGLKLAASVAARTPEWQELGRQARWGKNQRPARGPPGRVRLWSASLQPTRPLIRLRLLPGCLPDRTVAAWGPSGCRQWRLSAAPDASVNPGAASRPRSSTRASVRPSAGDRHVPPNLGPGLAVVFRPGPISHLSHPPSLSPHTGGPMNIWVFQAGICAPPTLASK